jgi:enoyl-CoA hydratase/carnithine racemase
MAANQYQSFTLEKIANSNDAFRLLVSNGPMNMVNPKLLTELHAYLSSLEKAPQTAPKVVAISSDNADFWISHLDLRIVSVDYPLPLNEGDPMHLLHLLGDILGLFKSLSTLFIAEVNGLAVGGGNEFAVNMDMRFAGPMARFGVPEVAGGIIHGGGVQSLTKLIGPGRALEMMASSRAVNAAEAERIGLTNRSFRSTEELRDYVDTLATRIARFPRAGIAGTKKSIQECLDGTGSIQTDLQRLGQLAHTSEAQSAISKFIEFGSGEKGLSFELGLPDSCERVWS